MPTAAGCRGVGDVQDTMNFLLGILLLALPISVRAQDWSLGLGLNGSKAETELSSFSDLESVESHWKVSPAAAVFAKWLLKENMRLRSGLMLQEKSLAFTSVNFVGFKDNFRSDILYLSLPLAIEFQLPSRFSLYAGVMLDYALKDDCSSKGLVYTCGNSSFKRFSSSIMGGLVWPFFEHWELDINYQIGMSDVYEDVTLNTAQLMVAYRFE